MPIESDAGTSARPDSTGPRVDDAATADFHLRKVRIHGLVSKPEHNGARGQVLGYDSARDRWEVMLRGTTKTFWLKASNLIIEGDGPHETPPRSAPRQHTPDAERGYLRGLPRACAFVATSDVGRSLVHEALDGHRSRGIRIFFEAVDDALAMVDEQQRAPRPPRFWRDTPNPVSHLPEEQLDFEEQLGQQCAAMKQLGEFSRVCLLPVDNGFFAAFLAALDGLLMAREDAEVTIDWRVNPANKHFTYRPPNAADCVWRSLFAPVHRKSEAAAGTPAGAPSNGQWLEINARFNLWLTGRFRWRFRKSPYAEAQRRAYHAVFAEHVVLQHPQVRREIDTLGAVLRKGHAIGVHKRVDTPGTAAFQGEHRRVLSHDDFITALRRLIASAAPTSVTHVFLATDDASAEDAFRRAFGDLLIVRAGVRRTEGGVSADATLNEVHIKSATRPPATLQDAADVLCDAMLLACCHTVLHMDSNVTSAVAFMGPECDLVHIDDVL